MVKGKIESSGDAIKLHVDESYPLEEVRKKFTKKILFYTDEKKHNNETIIKIKEILDEHLGDIPVYLSVKTNNGSRDFYLNQKIKIEDVVIDKIIELLGKGGIKYLV